MITGVIQVFGGGVYLKNSPKLETGVTASSVVGGASTFGIGCKYTLGPDASLRANVNNASQVGLNYQQMLRDGITVTMSANIDGNKLNEPGHKFFYSSAKGSFPIEKATKLGNYCLEVNQGVHTCAWPILDVYVL